uniref:Methylenetetrahydrofolate reductase n=1 Tax=Geobacter metallireducens TaxID=28232 RepID=A0A831TWC9_GEOME
MVVDETKLRKLLTTPVASPTSRDLRRDGSIFHVGGELPPQETLETIFDSHSLAPAELFHLTFGAPDTFSNGEALARLIKRNFSAHILGTMDYPASTPLLEQAYAAGIDIIQIPLGRPDQEERRAALLHARTVFPRWGVASTLPLGEVSIDATLAEIDDLLSHGIVPLLQPPPQTGLCGPEEAAAAYSHLAAAWRRFKVTLAPLLPLIALATPLVPKNQGGTLRGFINRLRDRRLLAASDLRRALRVRQVEESFESAGL